MLRTNNKTYYLTTTRFNEITYEQNKKYREKFKHEGPLYGSPCLITDKIPHESKCIVIEMLNHNKLHKDYPGKIVGIGMIKNTISYKRIKMYEDQNYNRYTYFGKYHITREEIEKHNITLLHDLENAVFKGKDHLKRSQGITKVPENFSRKVENVGEKIYLL